MPKVSALTLMSAAQLDPDADSVLIVDGSAGQTKRVLLGDLIEGGQAVLKIGTGSPEGAVSATAPAVYLDITDPDAVVIYWKTTGTGNTGWV